MLLLNGIMRMFCLLIYFVLINRIESASPRFTDLAHVLNNAIQRGSIDLPHSLSTADILQNSLQGSFPLHLPKTSHTNAGSTSSKSLRGPIAPNQVQVGGRSTPSNSDGAASHRLNPNPPISTENKMDEAWDTFVKAKRNNIPSLETQSKNARRAQKKTNGVAAVPKTEYKTPQELSQAAMAEYDEGVRNKNKKKHVDPNPGVYTPKAEHFGFKSPLDFIDSFDPFSHDSAQGEREREREGAPPLATLPSRSESPPLPNGSSSLSKDASSLSSTPVYHYTKLGGSISAGRVSASLADRGIFGTGEGKNQLTNAPNNDAPPQPMGRSSVSQLESDRAMSQFMTQLHSSNPVQTRVAVGPVRR